MREKGSKMYKLFEVQIYSFNEILACSSFKSRYSSLDSLPTHLIKERPTCLSPGSGYNHLRVPLLEGADKIINGTSPDVVYAKLEGWSLMQMESRKREK